jgi:GT2 family glycosyltransferase
MQVSSQSESKPYAVSIVIPTYGRPQRLARCLAAIANLDYPHDAFEVIVVDDGSDPPIAPVATPFKETLNLTLVRQGNAGPATARNTGAAIARGKFLVFTDDDCAPHPGWLQALMAELEQQTDCLAGGCTINALSNHLFSTASQLLVDYLYAYLNNDPTNAAFFTSNNFAMARFLFQRLGGFDTTFPLAAGEDREFCDRWLQAGYPMHYVAAARIDHFHGLSLKSFWRQHFNYGRGAFHFHQLRAQRNSEPIKVEPFAFYWHLLAFPFARVKPWSALPLSLLLFISQVANVMGFLWELSSDRQKSANQLQPNR